LDTTLAFLQTLLGVFRYLGVDDQVKGGQRLDGAIGRPVSHNGGTNDIHSDEVMSSIDDISYTVLLTPEGLHRSRNASQPH
jgi:hypothetical protein